MVFNRILKSIYYSVKPAIPRWLQIILRRASVKRKKPLVCDIWPIDPNASKPPQAWSGWPDKKQFALVLTHDVEAAKGQERLLGPVR